MMRAHIKTTRMCCPRPSSSTTRSAFSTGTLTCTTSRIWTSSRKPWTPTTINRMSRMSVRAPKLSIRVTKINVQTAKTRMRTSRISSWTLAYSRLHSRHTSKTTSHDRTKGINYQSPLRRSKYPSRTRSMYPT
ncbi:hypothetical protein K523DRAFT_133590 [Schizophyllum commune Tattone D]|nr:hypothetical protein K523DRAFT_133590 [Schizophyllum commune Tattone D]